VCFFRLSFEVEAESHAADSQKSFRFEFSAVGDISRDFGVDLLWGKFSLIRMMKAS
jgi:hypothetical protein